MICISQHLYKNVQAFKTWLQDFTVQQKRLLFIKFMSEKLIVVIDWILDTCNKALSSKEPEYGLSLKQTQNLSHCSGNDVV